MKQDEKKNRKEKLIDLGKIGAIIQKNFIVMTRDKIRLIPLLVFPIVMMLVLGFTTGNAPKHIPTAIVIYDDSILSQNIQQEISNSQTFSVKHVVSTEGEAKKLLDNGDIRVIIEIPPNLESDVNNNIPAQITVIVDESDSAVAATANGELNTIINSVSERISQEKLESYQQSVDDASQRLVSYTDTQAEYYNMIAAGTANNIVAEKSVDASKSILDEYTNNLLFSIPTPSLLIIPHNDTTQIFVDNQTKSTGQNFVIRQSPATQQIKAQANVLQQSSSLLKSAQSNMAQSSSISQKSIQGAQKLQESYPQNVAGSANTIRIFTHSKIENVLRPLVLEEKPAYGTGKRAIDFLIPSLIALTLFQGAVMGMGRAVAGEKRDGSLTRVFLTPTSNVTIIIGTITFYVLFELLRAAFLIAIATMLFNTHIEGSILLILLILVIYVSISIAIGMIISSLVKTEQQFISMAMLVSLPTMFLAGAFFPVQAMPKVLQAIATILPATYAGEALRDVMVKGFPLGMTLVPLGILLLFLALLLTGVFLVFKRDIE